MQRSLRALCHDPGSDDMRIICTVNCALYTDTYVDADRCADITTQWLYVVYFTDQQLPRNGVRVSFVCARTNKQTHCGEMHHRKLAHNINTHTHDTPLSILYVCCVRALCE